MSMAGHHSTQPAELHYLAGLVKYLVIDQKECVLILCVSPSKLHNFADQFDHLLAKSSKVLFQDLEE